MKATKIICKDGENMLKQLAFGEVWKSHFKTLAQYVPIVARVHGGSHPEFHKVHKLFEAISSKIKETDSKSLDLSKEFEGLREVTDNYTVPEDVCGSYQEVYRMLSEADQAYQAI